MAKIDAFFKLMNEQGASDLHLVAGLPRPITVTQVSQSTPLRTRASAL